MIRGFPIGVLLVLAQIGAAAPAAAGQVLPGPIPGNVERVVDGDTLAVRVQVWIGQDLRVLVRLRGVDAPERRGTCAAEREMAERATAALAALVAGNAVLLSAVEGDKYFGRVIASVATPAGDDLSTRLLKSGLARPYSGGARRSWCANAAEPLAAG